MRDQEPKQLPTGIRRFGRRAGIVAINALSYLPIARPLGEIHKAGEKMTKGTDLDPTITAVAGDVSYLGVGGLAVYALLLSNPGSAAIFGSIFLAAWIYGGVKSAAHRAPWLPRLEEENS